MTVAVTDRMEGHRDALQTERTSWPSALHAPQPTPLCDRRQTGQRISKYLPAAAGTAHPCRRTEALQHLGVSPATKIPVLML